MFLVSLIYASKVTDKLQNDDGVADIVKKARLKNESLDITGILCFDNKYFLQCLEGPRSTVNHLYSTIVDDPRHSDILLLHYGEISTRAFSDWGMELALPTKSKRPLLLKYAPRREFNPYEMSGESAKRLLLELAKKDPAA